MGVTIVVFRLRDFVIVWVIGIVRSTVCYILLGVQTQLTIPHVGLEPDLMRAVNLDQTPALESPRAGCERAT